MRWTTTFHTCTSTCDCSLKITKSHLLLVMNPLVMTVQLVARKVLRFNWGVTQLASLPAFLQHLKCFNGWKVQDDPKEAVKRYYEKHPQELKRLKKTKAKTKAKTNVWQVVW